MNLRESNIRIPSTLGSVPALILEPEHSSKGTILIYPGLGASKEIQRKEMNWLAEDGFTAVVSTLLITVNGMMVTWKRWFLCRLPKHIPDLFR